MLTDAGFGVVTEQPTLRTETLGLAQILIERNAAIVATATADRRYDEDLTRTRMSCRFEVNVGELLSGVWVTTLTISIIVSSITTWRKQSYF